jgi:hypothetical protein
MHRLYPQRKIEISAPAAVEISVMRQPHAERLLVHLANLHVAPYGLRPLEPVTEFPTWEDIQVSIDLSEITK